MRLSLELLPAEGDRLEGRIFAEDGRADLAFSGTLDLLRVLEEIQHAQNDDASADSIHHEGSYSEGDRSSC